MPTAKEILSNVKGAVEAGLRRGIPFRGDTAEGPADIGTVVDFMMTEGERSYITNPSGIVVVSVGTADEVFESIGLRGAINLRTRFKDGSFYELKLGLGED